MEVCVATNVGELRIGLLGLGQVGGGVAKILAANASEIEARLGARLRLVKALVRDASVQRLEGARHVPLTTNPKDIIDSPEVDIVVEVMGGIEPARELILAALAQGKPVVTANKALLSEHGSEIFAAATKAGVDVLFEAAVCGGIPIIRTLREALASDRIESIRGIVNGTTNFILTALEEGLDYSEALAKAQELGLAEADPTADVSGLDAAQKLQLLASLAFGANLRPQDVARDGIERVEPVDFVHAREFGCTIRLLANARHDGETLTLSVRPTLIPEGTPLSTIKGPFNAVELQSWALGPSLLVGQGAGSMPTGSAVVSDIIEAGRNLNARASGRVPHMAWLDGNAAQPRIQSPESRRAEWYLRFTVADKPGVLGHIAGALGSRGISIAAVIQRQRAKGSEAVPVVVVTHEAPESAVTDAVTELDAQGFTKAGMRVFPIEREPQG